jgi:hypothetical protein
MPPLTPVSIKETPLIFRSRPSCRISKSPATRSFTNRPLLSITTASTCTKLTSMRTVRSGWLEVGVLVFEAKIYWLRGIPSLCETA